MSTKKNTNNKENVWKDYLSSIEKKPQKSAKKSSSITQKFKTFFEKIGIGKPKEINGEEIKKQVGISAKEAKKWPIATRYENTPVEKDIYKKPKIVLKQVTKKPIKPEEKIAEKKSYPSKMEKYIARIEKKQNAKKAEKELEKRLKGKRRAGEKKRSISKKISFMPKTKKKKTTKKTKQKIIQTAERKKAKIEKTAKEKLKEPISKKVIAAFFKPEPSLAKKSIEEIKKFSSKQIKKEVKKARVAKKARGWYGNSLKHKKAAISGWRLRKKVKLHQLKNKEKTTPLTNKEKIEKKKLIYEDKELKLKIRNIDQKIKSLNKITKIKNKENKTFEKKIKASGIKIPKAYAKTIEKEDATPTKKEDLQQIIQAMKNITREIATTAPDQTHSITDFEKEDGTPIEDRITSQEKLIKHLEISFYKRKIDFNQFREKMFDYQSKLTELKIQKQLRDERLAKMSPEMRKEMEERKAARRKGPGLGMTPKTAKALEKIATKTEKEDGEKTASIFERIAARIGNFQGKKHDAIDNKPTAEKDAEKTKEKEAAKKPEEKKDLKKTEEKETLKKTEAILGKLPVQPQPSTPPYTGKTYPGQNRTQPGQTQPGQTQPGQTQPGQGKAYPQTPTTTLPAEKDKKKEQKKTGTQPKSIYAGPVYAGPTQGYPQTPVSAPSAGKKRKKGKGKARAHPKTSTQQKTQPYTGKPYQGQAQPYPYPLAPQVGKKRTKGKEKKGTVIGTESLARPPTYESNIYQKPVYQNKPFESSEKGRKGMPKPAADFYDEKQAKKKGILEKIKEQAVYRQVPVAPEVEKAIREKAAVASPTISKKEIDKIEQKIGELVQKYHIPNKTVAAHIETLDSKRLLNNFQNLIDVIETKRESAAIELIRPAQGFDIKSGIISKKKEQIVGKEKEIRRAKIETSFDRLLNLVKIKGIINIKDAAKQSGMTKKEVQECAEILERSRLINLSYPPIGPVKLIYPAYLKWKMNEKKKKREAKKKKK